MAERCDKLAGIDVAAYLDDPGDPRWGAIRAHAEKCRDCREEVAAWQSLRASLAVEGDGHPAEDLLLAYADDRSSLAVSVVEEIEGHLVQCVSCRDEVGVLSALTIRPTDAVATAQTRSQVSVWERILATLSSPVWRPSLAVAVLVVLMVPALRWIDRDGALMEPGADRNREAVMVSSEDGFGQRAVADAAGARAPAAETTDALRGTGAADAGTRVNVPALSLAPRPAATPAPMPAAPSTSERLADDAQVQTPPVRKDATEERAVAERALVAPSQESRDTDPRPSAAQLHAARRANSFGVDAFSDRAMKRESERGLSQAAPPPTVDFVPGGRVLLEAGDYEEILLRVRFVRGVDVRTKEREKGILADETAGHVVAPPNVSQFEIRVTTADGRESRRRLDVVLGESTATTSMVEISAPVDWFGVGENKVDIVFGEGYEVARLNFVFSR